MVNNSLFNYKVGDSYFFIHRKVGYYLLSAYIKYHDVFNGNKGYLTYLPYKFDSVTLPVEDLQPEHFRLLEVTKAVLIPIHRWVRVNVTGISVIHS